MDVNALWAQDFIDVMRQVGVSAGACDAMRLLYSRHNARVFLQSIGAMANASRRQQDTMVTKSKHWSHVTRHTPHTTGDKEQDLECGETGPWIRPVERVGACGLWMGFI